MEKQMLEITTTKNKELGLWDITATLTLPPITVTRLKKDKSDIEYELRDAFSDIITEIVEKHCEDEV
tara:strand:+ start:2074 stop:2274 length:201 start_codon:yes stop_codon:yes gene_type:complete